MKDLHFLVMIKFINLILMNNLIRFILIIQIHFN